MGSKVKWDLPWDLIKNFKVDLQVVDLYYMMPFSAAKLQHPIPLTCVLPYE